MAVREILLLGNPELWKKSDPVVPGDLAALRSVMTDLHDTLMDFRERYGTGRAIAAPQIGVHKRFVYMHIDAPTVFLNPRLEDLSTELFELWDDCMSFPDLLVRVRRHQSCRIVYRDMDWTEQMCTLRDGLSELLQHECDHLDGILAVERAIDGRSFADRSQRQLLRGMDSH
jgi:peptide deformylase